MKYLVYHLDEDFMRYVSTKVHHKVSVRLRAYRLNRGYTFRLGLQVHNPIDEYNRVSIHRDGVLI